MVAQCSTPASLWRAYTTHSRRNDNPKTIRISPCSTVTEWLSECAFVYNGSAGYDSQWESYDSIFNSFLLEKRHETIIEVWPNLRYMHAAVHIPFPTPECFLFESKLSSPFFSCHSDGLIYRSSNVKEASMLVGARLSRSTVQSGKQTCEH